MEELLAYCDGGSRGNPGDAAIGVYFPGKTDYLDRPITISRYIGTRTNNEAEYEALIAALMYALEYGYRKVKVISDSQVMVRQMQGKYCVKAPNLIPLFQTASELAASFEFEIEHQKRDKTFKADELVNYALDKHQGKLRDKV